MGILRGGDGNYLPRIRYFNGVLEVLFLIGAPICAAGRVSNFAQSSPRFKT